MAGKAIKIASSSDTDFEEIEIVTTSAGSGDSGKLVDLDGAGKWDTSVIPQTFDFDLSIGDGTSASRVLNIDCDATSDFQGVQIKAGGVLRHQIGAFESEGGGNTGSNFWVSAYDDSGVSIDVPLKITRASGGDIDLARPLDLNSNEIKGATTIAASSDVTVGGTSVVLEARSLTGGDGIAAIGDLSANRTVAVNSTVVRTSGTQSIGGVKTFTSAIAIRGSGSQTSPDMYFDGDPDTGIYSNSANTMRLTAGGNFTMQIESGRVGINDSGPSHSLSVIGDGRFTSNLYAGASIDMDGGGLLKIYDADSVGHEIGAISGTDGVVVRTLSNRNEIFQCRSSGQAVRFRVDHGVDGLTGTSSSGWEIGGKHVIALGNGFTISTSSPSGGQDGDIWAQV